MGNRDRPPLPANHAESPRQAGQNQGSRQQNFQSGNGQQQQNGGTTKRWKKKFRDRDRQRPGDNPGNQASNGNGGSNGGSRDRDTHQFGNTVSGFKRKGGGGGGGKQQRGPRSFVGPMDHSYRVANGNFADAPPSTIETHGNYQPRRTAVAAATRATPSPSTTRRAAHSDPGRRATKIFFFIDDLFFVAKIQETARKLGVKVEFVKNDKEALARLTGGEEADRPGLIVFDLNNVNAKPITLIPKLKAKLKRAPRSSASSRICRAT